MGRRQAPQAQPARGVTIRTTSAGRQVLQLAFTYKGKRYRKSLNVSPTPNNILAANRRLEQIRLEIQMGTFDPDHYFEPVTTPQDRQRARTISDLVQERIARKARLQGASGWEASTHTHRLRMFTKHLEPAFGHLTLAELQTHHVRTWLNQQTFSLGYGQMILSLLNPIIDEALADGTLDRHPYKHLHLSDYLGQKSTQERKERIDPLDEEEVHRLLQIPLVPEERNYLQFMLFSGLRIQEAQALRWSDLDWVQRTLHVQRAIGRSQQGEYIKATKTGEDRVVELLPLAWEALMNQRQYTQLADTFIFRPRQVTQKPKYPWLAHTQIRSVWNRALKKAGIRSSNRSPKQTRHTFCSLMIASGKPLTWVAQQVGHSSLAMLEQHYAKAVRLAAHKHQDYDFQQALTEARQRANQEQSAKG